MIPFGQVKIKSFFNSNNITYFKFSKYKSVDVSTAYIEGDLTFGASVCTSVYKRFRVADLVDTNVQEVKTKAQVIKLNSVGVPHCDSGPAVVSYNGVFNEFYKDGQLHREDGPAVIFSSGNCEWWLNGIQYNTMLEYMIANEKHVD